MRSLAPALILTAALVGSLAACTAPIDAESCTPQIPSGEPASYVTATGAVGTAPQVTFPTPLRAESALQAVVASGDEGASVAGAGQVVDFQVSLFNGTDGELITQTSYDPDAAPVRRTAGADTDILASVVQCAAVGSRIAATGTIADVFGAGQLDPGLGLADDDAVVMVIDIEAVYLGKATGIPQLGRQGVPAVVTTPEGVPGITIPNEDAPSDLIVHTLVRGQGTEVAEGDSVVLHYTGVLWSTQRVFDSSWQREVPSTFTAASFENDPSGVVPGLAEGLIGQTVGSQVIVVIPPALGYPAGQAPASVPDGSTMVFVVDILGLEG
ncbi:MAG: FKBP-type peptidyl-prolyl cis-trans isomerase [Microcella sp.]|uniref:FKBP-type peptidyl-prolyl cis-trans isomerase n=1 Tax=Microcella sp. TaxID=1913979 RepID=UPI003315D910